MKYSALNFELFSSNKFVTKHNVHILPPPVAFSPPPPPQITQFLENSGDVSKKISNNVLNVYGVLLTVAS